MCFRTRKPIGFFCIKTKKSASSPQATLSDSTSGIEISMNCEAAYGVNRIFFSIFQFFFGYGTSSKRSMNKIHNLNPMWPAGLGASSLGVFHGRLGVQKIDLLSNNLCLLPIFLGLYFY